MWPVLRWKDVQMLGGGTSAANETTSESETNPIVAYRYHRKLETASPRYSS
jgi:hypothetical protein